MTESDPRPDDDAGPSPVTGERDIPDESLPEDVRPGEDNPLADPPADDADDDGIDLRERS